MRSAYKTAIGVAVTTAAMTLGTILTGVPAANAATAPTSLRLDVPGGRNVIGVTFYPDTNTFRIWVNQNASVLPYRLAWAYAGKGAHQHWDFRTHGIRTRRANMANHRKITYNLCLGNICAGGVRTSSS